MKLNIQLTLSDFKQEMADKGWVIFHELFPMEFIQRLISDSEHAYKICRAIQIKNKVDRDTEYTLHHLIGQGDAFMEIIDAMEQLDPYLEHYFQGRYILNSLGGAINSAYSRSYAHRVHRDIRTFSGEMPLLLNTLIMMDDFTEDNGATYMMPGSHKRAEKPSEQEFESQAVRALGKAGSMLVFNSNVWHRGGDNNTPRQRRSLTPMYCRPFIKPQYDYSRFVGYDNMAAMSDYRKQLLGYFSRIPENLDQWYQLPENRMYRPGQG